LYPIKHGEVDGSQPRKTSTCIGKRLHLSNLTLQIDGDVGAFVIVHRRDHFSQ
jgi:hypothetical protein